MNESLDEMSEAELADWQYEHREELDSEDGELVDVEISPQLSVMMSFRLLGAEADAIREAAEEAGMSLSEWIRQACAQALDPGHHQEGWREIRAVLDNATRQLEDTKRQLDRARKKNRLLSKRTSQPGRAGRDKSESSAS